MKDDPMRASHVTKPSSRGLLLVAALLPALLGADPGGRPQEINPLPDHVVEDASAPVVSASNLLESERFWPERVALVKPWQPVPREQSLAPETTGVLIRVEPSGLARIDFGRDGLHQVPVADTDLIARANRIRLGEDEKAMPNFVFGLGPRLVDASADSLTVYPMADAMEKRGFLCVFADPAAPGFAELAKALAPLRDRADVLTVLFPQGSRPDPEMRAQLRGLGWPVAFVMDHLAEAYTPTLLDAGDSLPFVQLQTSEGRVLFESGWGPGARAKLEAALDASFGSRATATAAGDERVAKP